MSNMALAKLEEYRQESLRVLYDVESTWYDLYRIRKSVELTGRNIEILQGIEEIALIRYKTSPGSSGDPQMNSQQVVRVSQIFTG
jgi:outer membrane protein TolC